ncbi:MAG: carbohydrate ABC transporter permease [Limnochordia bacterium]
MDRKTGMRLGDVLKNFGTYLFTALFFFPIYWLLMASFVGLRDMVAHGFPLVPPSLTLESYRLFFKHPDVWNWLWNSIVVALVSTGISLVLSIPAAYALARLRFRGRELMGRLILFTYIVPSVLLLVPVFLVMTKLKLTNTLQGLILTHVTFSLPFCIWMLRGFFASIPSDLEDAGRVDGCSRLGVISRIVLPVSGPGIAAAATFTFTLSWQEYLFAFTLMSKQNMKTLPVAIAGFPAEVMDQVLWANMMASSVIATLPVFILFLYLEKYFVQGLTAGAVKG